MKEWYLMTDNNSPHMLGGFENDSFLQYKDDSFYEVLQTDIATTVTVYNTDLSESKTVRCIIQDNVANTLLNSMGRCGLFLIGTVKAGNYILFQDRYWLVTGYPGNNGVYEKATLELCQYCIRWQDSEGNIFDRWVNLATASKYEMGESGNNVITVTTNNITMLVGYDIHTLELDEKRIFLDRHPTNPRKVFKVTRNDDPLYNYGDLHGSILSFVLDKVEFNKDVDNQKLRICDYYPSLSSVNSSDIKPPQPPIAQPTLDVIISGNPKIKIGYSRIYTVSFPDIIDAIDCGEINLSWHIESNDFSNDVLSLEENYGGSLNKCRVKCINDETLIGKTFCICINRDDQTIAKKNVEITSIYG